MSGPIASGSQYMSWITLEDAVRAIEHAISRCVSALQIVRQRNVIHRACRPELTGPVNVVAPNPVTNSAFMHAFAAAMHRPAVMPMPEIAVRTIFGEMGEETLLVSQRAVPAKLSSSGFRFMHPEIQEAMRSVLHH
jgi:NAD dependent epimerase/dehydratase family enzyme